MGCDEPCDEPRLGWDWRLGIPDCLLCLQAEVSHIDDEALVYALQLRASYGGMGFDVK
jgi:hypothetical protein